MPVSNEPLSGHGVINHILRLLLDVVERPYPVRRSDEGEKQGSSEDCCEAAPNGRVAGGFGRHGSLTEWCILLMTSSASTGADLNCANLDPPTI